MKNPKTTIKDYAVSQYPRGGADSEAESQGFSSGKVMGYSIRTDRYRYTVWLKNFRSNQPFKDDLLVGSELYDYEKDPNETVNVVKEKSYTTAAKEIHQKMLAYFEAQVKK